MCVFHREVVCGAHKTVKVGSQITTKYKLMRLYLKVYRIACIYVL